MSAADFELAADTMRQTIAMLHAGEVTLPVSPEMDTTHLPHLHGVQVESRVLPGPVGDVPVRVYRGPAPTRSALVWVHGGGFIGGDLAMPEAHWVGLEMAARGINTISVDYRKALHGVHHPAPLDDVAAAWANATAHAEQVLGVSSPSIHLGGASAGAALASSLLLRLRHESQPLPAALVLVYGLFHPELPTPSDELRVALADVPAAQRLGPAVVTALSANYIGTADLHDATAFSGLDKDLAGLPPTYLLNAELDDLRSSGEMFAHQLSAAGTPVRIELEVGAGHGFLNEPDNPAAARGIQRLAQWILHHTPPASSTLDERLRATR